MPMLSIPDAQEPFDRLTALSEVEWARPSTLLDGGKRRYSFSP
jgi:hypothetical protein